jgi:DNA repair exonuclease SbcCD nuclease subunit
VSLDELKSSGFDYWALGHVHTRSTLAMEPVAVAYPGNPQGRNAREPGPRGCLQVDIDRNGQAHMQFIETSQVRWAHLEVSIRELTRIDKLISAMQEHGREAAAAFDGPTVARCTLRGNGPLHRELQRDGMAEELREQLQSVLSTESVRISTGPELDFESITHTETLVSDFLKLADNALNDPEIRVKLTDSLAPLFRKKELTQPDDARLREWIERARSMGVDLLLDT